MRAKDPKWNDRLADYLDSLAGAFVLGCVAGVFLAPIMAIWFVLRWWLQ